MMSIAESHQAMSALWLELLPGERALFMAQSRAGLDGYIDHDFIAWCLRVHPHGVYRLARHLASRGEYIEILVTPHGRIARLQGISVWCLLANHDGAGPLYLHKVIPFMTSVIDWSNPALEADALFLPTALRQRDPRDKLVGDAS